MERKLSVLCLLPSVPVPAETGGTQRSLAIVTALDQSFSVTVVGLLSPGCDTEGFRKQLRGRLIVVDPMGSMFWRLTAEPRALLRGAPLRYARYASPPVRVALQRVLQQQRFDLVHFDHPHMGQLLPLVRRMQPWARIVLDEHNVEAQVIDGFAALLRWPQRALLHRQADRVMGLERRLVQEADATLACSDINAAELRRFGARHVEVIPNGTTRLDSEALGPRNDRRVLVFVGSLDWLPNIDAAMRLVTKIWPRARDAMPGSLLAIVGRKPPPRLVARSSERDVLITGRVESVAPYLRIARATAIPLRAGSGTRIKILEAWAAGVPVITSRLGAEGLAYEDQENLLLAESDQEFADAMVRVWHDSDLAHHLTSGGAQTATRYEQAKIDQRLVSFYAGWLSSAEVRAAERSARA